jgi:hypothetical protein
VLVEVRAVHHRRPDCLLELGLAVADQVGERLVDRSEVAVERDHRHRLRDVVEARARLALRAGLLRRKEGLALAELERRQLGIGPAIAGRIDRRRECARCAVA